MCKDQLKEKLKCGGGGWATSDTALAFSNRLSTERSFSNNMKLSKSISREISSRDSDCQKTIR